ncbi:MAG TPA: hypothetical protein VK914_05240 [bacterium]|jgi:hypothetical protein|nr:hypothetical protein [bacterium]
MSKTAAQQQIELLKRMKAGRLEPSAPVAAPAPRAKAKKTASPRVERVASLPLSRETWRLLLRRQAATREFRGKKDMGEWAARLVLALPAGAHSLDADAIEELFACMRAFCAEKGLR